MLNLTLLVGLAAGYLTHLLGSKSAPAWWQSFIWWWKPFGGKPFSCSMCMGFWLSAIAWAFLVRYMPYPGAGLVVVVVFSSAAVSFLYDKLIEHLSITVL